MRKAGFTASRGRGLGETQPIPVEVLDGKITGTPRTLSEVTDPVCTSFSKLCVKLLDTLHLEEGIEMPAFAAMASVGEGLGGALEVQRRATAGQCGIGALVHELGTEAEFLLVPGDGDREVIDQQLRGNEFDTRQDSFLRFMVYPPNASALTSRWRFPALQKRTETGHAESQKGKPPEFGLKHFGPL